MKATITSVGGRAPPVRKTRTLSQDLVRPLQFEVFAFELLEALALIGGQAWALAAITFGLPHPRRNASTVQPSFSATERIVAHGEV